MVETTKQFLPQKTSSSIQNEETKQGQIQRWEYLHRQTEIVSKYIQEFNQHINGRKMDFSRIPSEPSLFDESYQKNNLKSILNFNQPTKGLHSKHTHSSISFVEKIPIKLRIFNDKQSTSPKPNKNELIQKFINESESLLKPSRFASIQPDHS